MVLYRERSMRVAPDWLPDDTEESVVGTEWHQEAIGQLADMLRDAADRRGSPWGVCEQIELGGLQRRDGTVYAPKPDVMVLPQPLAGHRARIHLNEAGTPLFVAEVASSSTVRGDREGKREAYAGVGIPEYLIFDPAGHMLDAPIEAWRLPDPAATAYVAWVPERDGWWYSRSLDLAFRPDQPLIAVRDRDGALIETSSRARRTLRMVQGELRAERAARASLEEQLRTLREQLGG